MQRVRIAALALVCAWASKSSTAAKVVGMISIGTDNAEEWENSGYRINGNDMEVGGQSGNTVKTGLRFQNLNVPRGAEITSAKIRLTAVENSLDETCTAQISGVDTDNSATFSSSNLFDQTQTSAKKIWNVPRFDSGTPYYSSDISAVVQEIIDRPGWSSGNAITFFIAVASTKTDISHRRSYSFKSSNDTNIRDDLLPRVIIDYTLPTKSPTLIPTLSPTTKAPTTKAPTTKPTQEPTTQAPTREPTTKSPTTKPTQEPTTQAPTREPTTKSPTQAPTDTTKSPTSQPSTGSPTSNAPTKAPSIAATEPQLTAQPSVVSSTGAPSQDERTVTPTTPQGATGDNNEDDDVGSSSSPEDNGTAMAAGIGLASAAACLGAITVAYKFSKKPGTELMISEPINTTNMATGEDVAKQYAKVYNKQL